MIPKPLAEFPFRNARTSWRTWIRTGAVWDLDLGIASSFTVDAMVPYLGHALLSVGWSPRIRLAPFNQVFQALSAPKAAFGGSAPETLLLLPRLDELVADELARFCGGDSSAWAKAKDKLLELVKALATGRETLSGTLILGTFPPPNTPQFDLLSLDRLGVLFLEKASAFWREATAAVDGIQVLDVGALVSDFGARHAFDPRKWYLYRQPFSEQFFFELGNQAARLISATRRSLPKCAVMDCDNTLWGGIIGEDGIDGIQLGDEFPGSAYRDLQKLLLHWRRQGVFLAVCSKNNLEDVQQVFRDHRAMELRESHISAWAVDWRAKSEQLTDISSRLNIDTDALVFLDDSSYEIAQVLARHPNVRCIQVPAAPELIISTVRRAMPFDKLEITNDDHSRVERFAVEAKRSELRQSLPLFEFIASLDLHVDTMNASADNLARITQLINKTNQFNLTGIRLTQDQVRTMARSAAHIVRAAVVRDKFGDYGLTCVGILERRDHQWHMMAFILSCRVLGRGVETCFLADLASEVVAQGGDLVTAEFNPTPRNTVAADFLGQHGFTKLECGLWEHSAAELVASRLVPRA